MSDNEDYVVENYNHPDYDSNKEVDYGTAEESNSNSNSNSDSNRSSNKSSEGTDDSAEELDKLCKEFKMGKYAKPPAGRPVRRKAVRKPVAVEKDVQGETSVVKHDESEAEQLEKLMGDMSIDAISTPLVKPACKYVFKPNPLKAVRKPVAVEKDLQAETSVVKHDEFSSHHNLDPLGDFPYAASAPQRAKDERNDAEVLEKSSEDAKKARK